MKTLKRNAVIITVLLFVCTAVYLNWAYGKMEDEATNADETLSEETGEETVTAQPEKDAAYGSLYYIPAQKTESTEPPEKASKLTATQSEYFAKTRLSRQQKRDEAAETLKVISENETASQDVIDAALDKMICFADWAVREAEVESMIVSKGFDDCVVFMTNDDVTVTVTAPTEGLTSASVAKISDIVVSNTDYDISQLKIIEIK